MALIENLKGWSTIPDYNPPPCKKSRLYNSICGSYLSRSFLFAPIALLLYDLDYFNDTNQLFVILQVQKFVKNNKKCCWKVNLLLNISNGWQDIGMHLLTSFEYNNSASPSFFSISGHDQGDISRISETWRFFFGRHNFFCEEVL